MTKLRVVIELDVNESGIPFVERPPGALLECRCFPPTPESPTPQVHLQGNPEGLRWLAEKALAIANARPEGYHVHLGREEGLEGVELLLARAPRR